MIEPAPCLSASATTFAVSLPVRIRRCRESDLSALEWFGTLTHQREFIQRAYARQLQGEVVMLLAMVDQVPIGQVWVDVSRHRDPRAGWIWALRVFPWLRNRGIGSRLLDAAELVLAHAGCVRAELAVELKNIAAQRLYERRGYRRVRKIVGDNTCTTPWDKVEHQLTQEALMRKSIGHLASASADSIAPPLDEALFGS